MVIQMGHAAWKGNNRNACKVCHKTRRKETISFENPGKMGNRIGESELAWL
jgi:hypothetical protein